MAGFPAAPASTATTCWPGPRAWGRDPRSEDRQLLLDAILAAREHLVILYTGADPRTNLARPPAVPVGEILDAADAAVVTPDGRPAREHVLVRHPLQPFDARNFVAGALGTPGPFSFDRSAWEGAEQAGRPRKPPRPFLGTLLPPLDPADTALADLVWFLEQPVRGFLRQRLGLTLVRDEEELADSLSVELDSLQKWAIGDRLLRARLAGADAQTCFESEWRRGTLPPGELGKRAVQEVLDKVEPLVVAASARLPAADGRALDVAAELGSRQLTGTVANVHGDTVVRVEYSRLGAKHRLRAWAQLLALTVARPRTPWSTLTIGRGARSPLARSLLGPIDAETARRQLGVLIDLHRRGLCAPLPMAVKTSSEYAEKRATGCTVDIALDSAVGSWAPDRFAGEQADPAHALVWGEQAPLAVLLAEQPSAAEQGTGWPADEPTRFGVLARRLWEPLLAAERRDAG